MNALFWAAVLAGASYWPGSHLPIDPVLLVVWKGAGVALLGLWAAARAREADGWLLAAVLAFGAAGDVLIETAGLETGAIACLIGHCVAIALYLRNRQQSARWVAFTLAPIVAALAWWLPADRSAAAGIAFYSVGLGAMAACATISRFRLAAIGAWLFVASDLMIFARIGPLSQSALPGLSIWPLYFVGQVLIAWDVRRGLNARRSGAG